MPQSSIFLSTDMVAEKYRNDFWSSISAPILEPSLDEDQGDKYFHGSIESRPLGNLLIGATTFNAQKYLRTKKHIAMSDLNQYILQFFTSGSLRADFDGQDAFVRAGDICIGDNLRPVKSHATRGATVSVVIPHSLIEGKMKSRLHGVVLRSENPTTRLLTDFLKSLHAMKGPLKPESVPQIENALVSLLTASVSSSLGWSEPDLRDSSMVLRERILKFISENLEKQDLGVAMLTQRFHVSRAHIYRAFSDDGGIAKIIRDHRLDAAYGALVTSNGSKSPIEEIAYRFGYKNYSHFSRAFREKFATTPGSVRDASFGERGAMRKVDQIHQHFASFKKEVCGTVS